MTNGTGYWDIDFVKIMDELKGSTGNVFLYLNIPENPVGTAYGHERWADVLKWAIANNIILIVDEAYTHLRFGDSCSVMDIPGWEECCIVLQSVSKGWNATGLRFGWIAAHPTFIKAIRTVMDVKDSGMFGPTIAMGLWCLKNPSYTEKTCRRYRELHATLAVGLQTAGFGGSMPQAGLCQFTPAPKSANGVVFTDAAECAKWFRNNLRISLMHYTVNNTPWLRWAVTIKPVPECGLPDELSVINETIRRLQAVKFEF
jgi:aspartate/methionine/tyrosine aminotransferase